MWYYVQVKRIRYFKNKGNISHQGSAKSKPQGNTLLTHYDGYNQTQITNAGKDVEKSESSHMLVRM